MTIFCTVWFLSSIIVAWAYFRTYKNRPQVYLGEFLVWVAITLFPVTAIAVAVVLIIDFIFIKRIFRIRLK